jgi:hypothetical protein
VGGIEQKPKSPQVPPLPVENGKRVWLRRSGFVALSLIGFYMTLLVLELFVYISGFSEWFLDRGHQVVILDQEVALWFISALLLVIIFTGLSTASISKAFEDSKL